MGSEGPKLVRINVTGFKKFSGVDENPSEIIVNNLRNYVEKRGLPKGVTLGICAVLETAGDGAVSELYKVLEGGMLTGDDSNNKVIWLHLGVNGGALRFAIELQAVNEATFCCPDELGWQPQQHPILLHDGGISQTRKTSCPVEAILELWKMKGHDATISHDAGRFVCNFVYYHSLAFAEKNGHKSLFVHIPLFSRIDEETQLEAIASLIEATALAS